MYRYPYNVVEILDNAIRQIENDDLPTKMFILDALTLAKKIALFGSFPSVYEMAGGGVPSSLDLLTAYGKVEEVSKRERESLCDAIRIETQPNVTCRHCGHRS